MRVWQKLVRHERGSTSAVEMVIAAPLFALVIALLITMGRSAHADNATQSAAMAAARTASLARTPYDASVQAQAAAQLSLQQAGVNCAAISVTVDTDGFNSPLGVTGTVSAHVSCTVSRSDLSLPGIPGAHTLTSTAISPVDAYRERG